MRYRRPMTTGLLLLLWACAGCRLPHNDGPVPQSLIDSRRLSQEGALAMERGQWPQGESLLSQAVTRCPVDPEARRHYAEALWHRGAQQEALAQMEAACRLTPEDAGLHARIAEMHLVMHQLDAARARVTQALELDPKLATAWAIRARVSYAAGQPREALAEYHRALGYAPDDRQVLLETAVLYRELNESPRALVTLHSLCDTYSPGEEPQQVLYLLGLTYLDLGRHEDAAGSLALAIKRGPATAEMLCRYGEAQAGLGRAEEALAAVREALALDPSHPASQDLFHRLASAGQQAGGPVQR